MHIILCVPDIGFANDYMMTIFMNIIFRNLSLRLRFNGVTLGIQRIIRDGEVMAYTSSALIDHIIRNVSNIMLVP